MKHEQHHGLLKELANVIEDIVGDAFGGELELNADTSLVYDLGLQSIEIIALLEQLRMRFGYPTDIVLSPAKDGQHIRDLRARDVVEFLADQRSAAEAFNGAEVRS